jgi:hypothetical protein
MSRRERKRESKDPADEKRRPDKPSYAKKLGDRVRTVGSLGETLVKEPKAFPKKTAHALRPWIRKVWKARGGGLYACGFVLTFVYLEISMLFGEIIAATGFVDFFTEQLLELPFRFLTESLSNLVAAFLWPLPLLEFSPPWGIAILAVIYLLFTYLIKEPLEKWLFHEEEQS